MNGWVFILVMLASMVTGAGVYAIATELLRMQREHRGQSNSSGNLEVPDSSGNPRNITSHELGHSMGISHSATNQAVMPAIVGTGADSDWFWDEWTDSRREQEEHDAMENERWNAAMEREDNRN